MRFAVRSFGSLRMLLVVMIAAPVVPTIASSILVLARVAHGPNPAASIAQIALAGMSLRIVGGGVALWAAGRLIRATRLLSRAAGALDAGASPSQTRSGIAEIDDVLEAIGAAARSLRRRSEAYQSAEAARRDSEARLSDFAETGSDWYWQTDREHRFTYHLRSASGRSARTRRPGSAAPAWELAAEAGSRGREMGASTGLGAGAARAVPRLRLHAQGRQRPRGSSVSVSGKPIFGVVGTNSAAIAAAPRATSAARVWRPSASCARRRPAAEAASLGQIAVPREYEVATSCARR